MLSLFPELLFLAPFAAFLIRIALAAVFGYSAATRIRSDRTLLKVFGAVDGVIAVMLLAGIYTQLAAIVGALCAVYWLIKSDVSPLPKSTVALALIMCLSLVVMGAGPFAFDLPL
ncbi:hypothetical protein A3A38_01545 [Candidatus Kaiserbacteria bacterium RIFCSPLOWO2_01_FULL_53_17]|uniref:Uncharacterized protein n=1 Tax=Candidatus Kaiserbacteria bacterium RIFCSPLOWO2_01_FULL_53_17 TaxID=1798511 RepID=A0A1F6EGY2_9BACT|nr:MAG: hypothetical protein A3A38_01545 [Candidatus Kaiserbacteria bacterium RIFCSPLOWO2_01_FULL_53_17]